MFPFPLQTSKTVSLIAKMNPIQTGLATSHLDDMLTYRNDPKVSLSMSGSLSLLENDVILLETAVNTNTLSTSCSSYS